MMMTCQISEAIRFHEANSPQLQVIETTLLDSVSSFVDRIGGLALQPDVVKQIKADLASREYRRYATTLRAYAVEFGRAGWSSPYWNAIDGLNFYSDAVGSIWPYMTSAKRAQSLIWANEEIQSLRAWMSRHQSPDALSH